MQLKQYKIYLMVWTSEISNDDGNKSIIKSYMEGNRCGNVLYCDTHTDVHIHTHTHT